MAAMDFPSERSLREREREREGGGEEIERKRFSGFVCEWLTCVCARGAKFESEKA